MTVASTAVPRWWLVTKPRKSPGELIGSDDLRRPRPPLLVSVDVGRASAEDRVAGAAFFDRRAGDLVALASGLVAEDGAFFAGDLRADVAGAAFFAGAYLASRVARRLTGPRTGTRATNTQPTPGTGLPPQSRPSENSHS